MTALPNIVFDDTQAKLTVEPVGEHRVYFEGATDQLKFATFDFVFGVERDN